MSEVEYDISKQEYRSLLSSNKRACFEPSPAVTAAIPEVLNSKYTTLL